MGRRATIIANSCIFIVGAIILATAHTYSVLVGCERLNRAIGLINVIHAGDWTTNCRLWCFSVSYCRMYLYIRDCSCGKQYIPKLFYFTVLNLFLIVAVHGVLFQRFELWQNKLSLHQLN